MVLKDKNLLITGVANHRSIAWAIAKAAHREGAKLAFAYHPRMEETVKKLINEEMSDSLAISMDATDDKDIDKACNEMGEYFDNQSLDGVVHSIAFAKRENLSDPFYQTDKEGFNIALTASVYSLIALARYTKQFIEKSGGGSIITLSYLGSERVIPQYNIMGVSKAALEATVRYLSYDLGPSNIRVNAISAGPVQTLSARGVKGFSSLYGNVKDLAPLRRNITIEEIANTAVFLLSDLSTGITGDTIYVDSGQNIMGHYKVYNSD